MRQDKQVDEITRAILYPWVRESLELLGLIRADMRRALDGKGYGVADILDKHRLKSRVSEIDRILDIAKRTHGT